MKTEQKHEQSGSAPPTPVRRAVPARFAALRKRTVVLARWLHIYLSMASFAIVLFFSATGITLNHADKLGGKERVTRYSGTVTPAAMQASGGPDKLAIVEQLRAEHNIRGAVTDFRNDEDQTSVSFKGAGYNADAFVDRPSGRYQLIETRTGAVAMMNDLHRGVVTGRLWSWVIDGSAVLLVLVSVTGLVLILFLYKRRTSGLILAAAAAIVVVVVVRLLVP